MQGYAKSRSEVHRRAARLCVEYAVIAFTVLLLAVWIGFSLANRPKSPNGRIKLSQKVSYYAHSEQSQPQVACRALEFLTGRRPTHRE
jgi:hypothetical protein